MIPVMSRFFHSSSGTTYPEIAVNTAMTVWAQGGYTGIRTFDINYPSGGYYTQVSNAYATPDQFFYWWGPNPEPNEPTYTANGTLPAQYQFPGLSSSIRLEGFSGSSSADTYELELEILDSSESCIFALSSFDDNTSGYQCYTNIGPDLLNLSSTPVDGGGVLSGTLTFDSGHVYFTKIGTTDRVSNFTYACSMSSAAFIRVTKCHAYSGGTTGSNASFSAVMRMSDAYRSDPSSGTLSITGVSPNVTKT